MDGLTFDVSDVRRAREPLPEVPYHAAIAHLLSERLSLLKYDLESDLDLSNRYRLESDPDDDDECARLEQQLAVIKRMEVTAARPIDACSRYHGRLVAEVTAHPFMETLHRAFTDHRPVSLSPDMLWLLICQGVAHHVNVHAERLRPRFVRHAGKAQILVERNDFIKSSPENPWGEVIDEFSQKVRQFVGATHDLFVPRFSTTGPTERIASEIVLLDAMQNYFALAVRTMCGIPSVTLEGRADDWQELADRAQAFAEFDLEWWLTPLQPILQELAATARGNVRPEFWQSIYKFTSFSGGNAVTGWIAAFFPYLKDEQGNPNKKNPWLEEGGKDLQELLAGGWGEDRFHPSGPARGAFPSGLASAPFIWLYLTEKFNMEFLGGFVGIAQDSATLALKPEIGWAIRQL